MKRTSGHIRPRPAKRRKAGQDDLRLIEVDGYDLSAISGVPAQGRSLEELRAEKEEAEPERVAQVDGRKLARGGKGEVHVPGFECLLKAAVGGAV